MATPLSANDLDRVITIEQRTVTRDPVFNSEVVTWSTLVAGEWAQVVESSTAPSSNPGQADAVAAYVRPTKVRIRWRSDVDTSMRINADGQLLQIQGTAMLGRRQWLEMSCQEWAHE